MSKTWGTREKSNFQGLKKIQGGWGVDHEHTVARNDIKEASRGQMIKN